MPTLPKGKVYIGFYVTQNVADEFRKVAKAKHSGMYGLSTEGEAALKKWLEQQTREHTQHSPFRSPVDRAYSKVIDYLTISRGIDFENFWLESDGASMPRNFLVDAIEQTIGNDRRTVRKWEEVFRRAKLVKDAGRFGMSKVVLRKPGFVETEDSKPEQKIMR